MCSHGQRSLEQNTPHPLHFLKSLEQWQGSWQANPHLVYTLYSFGTLRIGKQSSGLFFSLVVLFHKHSNSHDQNVHIIDHVL